MGEHISGANTQQAQLSQERVNRYADLFTRRLHRLYASKAPYEPTITPDNLILRSLHRGDDGHIIARKFAWDSPLSRGGTHTDVELTVGGTRPIIIEQQHAYRRGTHSLFFINRNKEGQSSIEGSHDYNTADNGTIFVEPKQKNTTAVIREVTRILWSLP